MSESNIVPLSFHDQDVRVVFIEGEPWWVAKDVCDILDISNSRDAIQDIDEDCVAQTDVTDALNRTRQTNIVNEPGLYELIFQSQKPEAKKFRKWITSEVLPQIRKTGKYTADPYQYTINLAEHNLEMARERYRANKEIEAQKLEIEAAKPIVKMAKDWMNADGSGMYVEHFGKRFELDRIEMWELLRDLKIVFRRPVLHSRYKMTEYHAFKGYESWFKPVPEQLATGETRYTLLLMPKGIRELQELLSDMGIYPTEAS